MDRTVQVFTVGHSNHPVAHFVELLKRHQIALVVDVRSQPYSQWAHQFNRELLHHDLQEARLRYVYMGDVLGGRPADQAPQLQGQERPDYEKMAQSAGYRQGIKQLLALAQDERLVVMCSEGDFRQCHRHHLITQTLLNHQVCVSHIKLDGTLAAGLPELQQLPLF